MKRYNWGTSDEANRILVTKGNREYPKDLFRGIKFKRGYQPRSNLVKNEKGDLLADSHNILNRLKNYFSWLLNVNCFSDVGQLEMQVAEPFTLDPSSVGVENSTEIIKF
jgi:hypothetical protein